MSAGAARSPVPLGAVQRVQRGTARPLGRRGDRTVTSGFVKDECDGPVRVSRRGLAGDEQADLRVHGGPDKAVCVYPAEHYAHWSARLGRRLPPAAFGENLTTTGLLETDLRIGDVLAVGRLRLQVTQPRRTCYKIDLRYGVPRLAEEVQRSGWTGFYCRVLHPGTVAAGRVVELVERGPGAIDLAEVNRVMNVDRHDRAGAEGLLGVPGLPERWRATLRARLRGALDDDRDRLRP